MDRSCVNSTTFTTFWTNYLGLLPLSSQLKKGRQLGNTSENDGLPWWLSGNETACNAGDPGREDALEESMATHSSALARECPWAEEPGRLQSMGSCGVGHD